jgi:hypothetical protein
MNKTLLRTAVSTLGLALSLAMSSAACAGHHEKSEKDAQQAMAMSAEEQAAMQAMAAAGDGMDDTDPSIEQALEAIQA